MTTDSAFSCESSVQEFTPKNSPLQLPQLTHRVGNPQNTIWNLSGSMCQQQDHPRVSSTIQKAMHDHGPMMSTDPTSHWRTAFCFAKQCMDLRYHLSLSWLRGHSVWICSMQAELGRNSFPPKKHNSWDPRPNNSSWQALQFHSILSQQKMESAGQSQYPVAFSRQRQHDHAFAPWLSGCPGGKELGLETIYIYITDTYPMIILYIYFCHVHHHALSSLPSSKIIVMTSASCSTWSTLTLSSTLPSSWS